MRLLPRPEWKLHRYADGSVAVGAHERAGWLHWTRLTREQWNDGAIADADVDTIALRAA